jgi:predicted O-linked N-acetylglucosamine transferase (SPINDLY family)
MMGYTRNARTALFVERIAPVQINYLGFPSTMALDAMDYIVGDAVVIPDDLTDAFGEKVIRLPGSFQPNDNARVITDCGDTRATLGLPEDAFVFCCFNQNYKFGPAEFDIWMRLLREVEGSVLWLRNYNDAADANLRREAEARGIDPARLIFAPSVASHNQHLARIRHADLFLDTFTYGAHTTASDALWGGLPVLTMVGSQFAARVGASLLIAMELPELITFDRDEYFERALHLARAPDELADLRARVEANRATHSLYDTVGYTRKIERAFEAVHARRMAGLAPDHVTIEE